MLECAAHVALAAVTGLGWLGAGTLALAPLGRTGDGLLDGLNRLGVGALVFALLTLAAAAANVLYAELYVSALAAAALVGAASLRGTRVHLRAPGSWPVWQRLLAGLLGLYGIAAALATCAPITSGDALFYHAAAPKLFERAHGLVEMPWSVQSYQPFNVEMLMLDGFLLWDPVQGAFAPLLLTLCAVAAVYGIGARLGGRSTGLLAATIFGAQPFLLWEGTSSFVEGGIALMLVLCAWNLWAFRDLRDARLLVIAGLAAGGAAGMKYLAALAAAILSVTAVALLRRLLTPRRVAAFALPALAVSLPWYVKNALQTGDPFYPFLRGGANAEAAEELSVGLHVYGHGRSPLDALLLPLRLIGDAGAFDRGEFLSPLFLLFAPLVFLVPAHRRIAGAVSLAVLAFGTVWFLSSQQTRFLMAALPWLAVMGALGAAALAARGRAGRMVTVAVTAGALLAGAAVSAVYTAQFGRVALGLQSRDAFLRSKVSAYDAVAYLNERLPPDARVLVDFQSVFPLEREYLFWSADVLPPSISAAELRKVARRYRLTHASVYAEDGSRRQQLTYLGARQIGSVYVREVISRTRSRRSEPRLVLVYALDVESAGARSTTRSRQSSSTINA